MEEKYKIIFYNKREFDWISEVYGPYTLEEVNKEIELMKEDLELGDAIEVVKLERFIKVTNSD